MRPLRLSLLAGVCALIALAGCGAARSRSVHTFRTSTARGVPRTASVQYCASVPIVGGIPPWGFHTGAPITGASQRLKVVTGLPVAPSTQNSTN